MESKGGTSHSDSCSKVNQYSEPKEYCIILMLYKVSCKLSKWLPSLTKHTYYKAILLVSAVHFRVCQVMAACIQWDLQCTVNRQGQTHGTTCTVAQPQRIITLWRAVPFAFSLCVIFYYSVTKWMNCQMYKTTQSQITSVYILQTCFPSYIV